MSDYATSSVLAFRTPQRLAQAIALACGLSVAAAPLAAAPMQLSGARILVQNCDDDGPGSLRAAVRDLAASGDIIDLGQLSCSRITLSTGAIATTLDDLSLVGPPQRIEIDADRQSSVFVHLGDGTIGFHDLGIRGGRNYLDDDPARGGCLYSHGNVLLNDVTLTDCIARSPQAASGGGARVRGHLTAKYSALVENSAGATVAAGFSSCGAAAAANATIVGSSIVANSADYFGGLCAEDANAAMPMRVSNSTIADNLSRGASPSTGGTGLNAQGALTLYNSTVAHNLQTAPGAGVGVYVRTTAIIESSIVANNAADGGAQAADLAGGPSASVSGSHNLIRASLLAVPADTLDVDPRLREIAVFLHGRPTAYVRAPRADSAAIDAGSNPLDLAHDQRGAPNARVSGAAADIGAVELDRDHLFDDGFEATPSAITAPGRVDKAIPNAARSP